LLQHDDDDRHDQSATSPERRLCASPQPAIGCSLPAGAAALYLSEGTL
jgi:hypothetical protein